MKPERIKLRDEWASHPNITGLPGLIFEYTRGDGTIMGRDGSIMLQALLDNNAPASAEHRLLCAYRIGMWFQYAVCWRFRYKTQDIDDPLFFENIQIEVRSKERDMSTLPLFKGFAVKYFFEVFAKARTLYRQTTVIPKGELVASNASGEFVEFLHAIDLWNIPDMSMMTPDEHYNLLHFKEGPYFVDVARERFRKDYGREITMAPDRSTPIVHPAVKRRRGSDAAQEVSQAAAPVSAATYNTLLLDHTHLQEMLDDMRRDMQGLIVSRQEDGAKLGTEREARSDAEKQLVTALALNEQKEEEHFRTKKEMEGIKDELIDKEQKAHEDIEYWRARAFDAERRLIKQDSSP